MRIPALRGVIARRLLVNFRADPAVVAPLLPPPFVPQLHDGHAVVGVCLIRLEQIRPAISPFPLGFGSENAAHRIAVSWKEADGTPRNGVYIPRRDTGSLLTRLAGGRLFPGEHFGADFEVEEEAGAIRFAMKSHDGQVEVRLKGRASSEWPSGSIFRDLSAASRFFEGGSTGYSARRDGQLDGLRLQTSEWRVEHLGADEVFSSFYADGARFPAGSIELDHVLMMRQIAHEWHDAPLQLESPA